MIPKIVRSGFTCAGPGGNKYYAGRGSTTFRKEEIQLSFKPLFINSLTEGKFIFFGATGENGWAEIFVSDNKGSTFRKYSESALVPGRPPLLVMDNSGKVFFWESENQAEHASASVLPDGRTVFVRKDFRLQIGDKILNINCLPDARPVIFSDSLLAVFSDPTDKYRHAVLGDAQEARSLTLINPKIGGESILSKIVFPDSAVAEGIFPTLAPVFADGRPGIAVTLSNNRDGAGARLVLYDPAGNILAKGHLSPGGWRHFSALWFDAAGKLRLADVQKPHVQKIAHFLCLERQEIDRFCDRHFLLCALGRLAQFGHERSRGF